MAFEELCRREAAGLISQEDSLEKRIDFLIEMWSGANCSATIAVLEWQKQVIQKYYARKGGEPYDDMDGSLNYTDAGDSWESDASGVGAVRSEDP